jgi:RNA polymerase sigma-70 factor (ECF subfamily)
MTVDQLTTEFETHKGQLKSYVLRMTASKADTEDILQDCYIKAFSNLGSFRGDSSLKTWLFTIAGNIARDLLKSKKRWPENVTDITKKAALSNPQFLQDSMQIRTSSPQGNFEMKEHIAFCFTCISKSLPLEQHLAVLLKEVHNFKVEEIAIIMDNTEAMVKYWLHKGRGKMIDIFEHRCALINKEGVCHQCTELNGIYNPKQNAQEELVKIEMVKQAGKADKEHLFDLRMKIVQEKDPYESGAAELQLHHLEHNRQVMEKISENS